MALKTFKEVIQNKGYRISTQDREVFEQGNLQSFFGLSDYDVIEFIIYDINDNQLPQSTYGLVRYMPLTTQNIKDYILIPQGTIFQKYKFPKEYFIDAERLLSEAGYTNGIFKVQVTLVNKRAGSGEEVNNKLWISEISPSRTEIRLFPLKKGLEEHKQLQERFNIFTNDKNFREDTINNAVPFVETAKAEYVKELITNKYTSKWFDKLRAEFKISNFDEFATIVRNTFVQSCQYEFTNRYSNIDGLDYGKSRNTAPALALSVNDIVNTVRLILTQTINHYLIKQDVKVSTTFDTGILTSVDAVTNILQRNEKDTVIDTSYPIIRQITTIASKQPQTDVDLTNSAKKEDPTISNPDPFVSTTTWTDMAPKKPIESTKYAPVTEKIARADESSVSRGTTQTYVEKTNAMDNEQQPVFTKGQDVIGQGGSNSTNTGTRGGGGGGNAGTSDMGSGGRIDDIIEVSLEPNKGTPAGAAGSGGNKKGGGGSGESNSFFV